MCSSFRESWLCDLVCCVSCLRHEDVNFRSIPLADRVAACLAPPSNSHLWSFLHISCAQDLKNKYTNDSRLMNWWWGKGTSLAGGIPVGVHNGSNLNQQSALMLTLWCRVKLINSRTWGNPSSKCQRSGEFIPVCQGNWWWMVLLPETNPDTPASLKRFLCLWFMLILGYESSFSFFSFFVSPFPWGNRYGFQTKH